jgi:hypothetical protein
MYKILLLALIAFFPLIAKAQKTQPEIFLTCGFYDRSNSLPYIFLYSPKNKIDLFGQPEGSGDKIGTRYSVTLKESNSNEYIFLGTDNEAAYYADIGRTKYYGDTIKINRKSLDISRRSNEPDRNSHFYNINFSYMCDVLDSEVTKKYIKQVLDERAEKAKNTKPNRI